MLKLVGKGGWHDHSDADTVDAVTLCACGDRRSAALAFRLDIGSRLSLVGLGVCMTLMLFAGRRYLLPRGIAESSGKAFAITRSGRRCAGSGGIGWDDCADADRDHLVECHLGRRAVGYRPVPRVRPGVPRISTRTILAALTGYRGSQDGSNPVQSAES